MVQIPDTQQAIEAEAMRLGANREAIFKWRQRGVPAAWKLRLMESGSFKIEDFSVFGGQGARHVARSAEAAE